MGRAVNFGLPDLPPAEAWVLIAGLCLTFVLCLHALIVPLRWIGSLRLGFQPPAGCRQSGVRMQWRVRHVPLWTIWCAIPCAVVRPVAPDHVVEILLSVALFGGFGLPLAVAMAFLVMSRRKLSWLAAAAAAWGLTTAAKLLIPDLFETSRIWEFNLAVVATVGGNLLLLRLGGLRSYRNNEPLTAADAAAMAAEPS